MKNRINPIRFKPGQKVYGVAFTRGRDVAEFSAAPDSQPTIPFVSPNEHFSGVERVGVRGRTDVPLVAGEHSVLVWIGTALAAAAQALRWLVVKIIGGAR